MERLERSEVGDSIFRRVVARKIEYGFEQLLSEELADAMAKVTCDPFSDGYYLSVRSRCLSTPFRETIERETVPADWWAAFKLRFFPRWLLKRSPARTRSIEIRQTHYKICPHIRSAVNELHMAFLMPEEVVDQSLYEKALDEIEQLKRTMLRAGLRTK